MSAVGYRAIIARGHEADACRSWAKASWSHSSRRALAVPTIAARLNADPAAYPSPDDAGWTPAAVT